MKYSTHVVTALSISTALVAFDILRTPDFSEYGFTGFMNYALFWAVITFASLLPDIDHSNSFISNRLGFSLPFKHRGFTHYIYLWSGLIFASVNNLIPHPEFFFWISIGALLHSFGDMHTKGGVCFFGFSKKIYVLPSSLVFNTGGALEKIFFIGYLSLFIYSTSKIL